MVANEIYEYQTFDDDSLEISPQSPFFNDHVSRYWWASNYTEGKSVLDCACGKGYGSFIFSKKANKVTGVDLNTRSLSFARHHFQTDNLRFLEQDIFQLKNLEEKFDVISAFEVIEHIPAELTDSFLSGLRDILSDQGVLLISTPNHDVVTKSGATVPQMHINNFRPSQLRKNLEKHFSQVEMVGQFRQRGFVYELFFSLDFFNWRHRFLRRQKIRKNLQEFDGVSAPETESVWGGVDQVMTLFDQPTSAMESYRFSRWHWRQAGLTVAVCRK